MGNNHKYNEQTKTIHHTDYDKDGRHSFDYDPLTGNITRDHSVSNQNQDKKKQ